MIKINGAEPKGFRINGSEVKKLIYNGQIVWEGWSPYGNIVSYGTGLPSETVDGDMGTGATVESGYQTLTFPEIAIIDKVTISARSMSASDVRIDIRRPDYTLIVTISSFPRNTTTTLTATFAEEELEAVIIHPSRKTHLYEIEIYGKVKL